MQPLMNEEELGKQLLQLKLNVVRLRSPEHGCPWFKQQTFSTLRKYLLEEVYEVQDALNSETPENLQEELGDLLFQIVVLCQLASEREWFSLGEVTQQLNKKIIHRNPHVFGDEHADTAEKAQQLWSERKSLEKPSGSSLDGLCTAVPALIHDFETHLVSHPDGKETGLGRLLFMLVHLAQRYQLNAEVALQKINTLFRQKVSEHAKD